MTTKRDQYGDTVPSDLGLLPNDEFLTEPEIEAVVSCQWYESGGVLLASVSELGDNASFDDPLDAGVDLSLSATVIVKVDKVLNRWGAEDGFYHA